MKKNLQTCFCMFLVVLCAVFASTTAQAQEQILLGWQFFNSNAGGKSVGSEVTYNSSDTHLGVNEAILSRGGGLTAYALQTGFSSVPAVLTSNYAAAYTSNAYFQFNFKPKANFKASLSALNAKMRLAGAYSNPAGQPFNYQWQYSIDEGENFHNMGSSGTITGTTVDAGVAQNPILLSGITDLQHLDENTNVIFRLYVWGFTNKVNTGTFGLGRSASATEFALSLSGTIENKNIITSNISEAYFTDVKTIAKGAASETIMDKLISTINATPAGESIYMSIYMINHQGVMDALKAAETKGVNLHIIVDMSRSDSQVTNASSLPWIQTNLSNSEIITCVNDVSVNAINHHKFVLFSAVQTVDGLLQKVTFQTSHNFTVSDTKKIQDALVFNSPDIYQAFLNNWELIKANASSGMKANFNFNSHDISSINTKLEFFPRIIGGVYDGEDNIVDNLNAITDVSNAKIRIAMSDWSDSRPAIVNKLITLRNQGATIEVYAKDAAGTQTKAKLKELQALGATVRIFNLEAGSDVKFNIHAKMMLIEGTWNGQANSKVIITGSHNYTDGALKTNNEVLVTLLNSGLFPQYTAYFDELKTIVPSIQLLAWNFNTLNTVGSEISNLSSETSGGLFNSTLLRGSGVKVNGLAKGMGSIKDTDKNTTISAAKDDAIANDDYFEFDVTPRPGKKISLSEIEYVVRRSSTAAPKTGTWMYVIEENGVAGALKNITEDITFTNGVTLNAGYQQEPISLANVQDLQNIGSGKRVLLRLYFWGATTSTATFGLGPYSVNNSNSLVLNGDLESVADDNVILSWSAGSLSGETVTFTSTQKTNAVATSTISRGSGLEASSLSKGYSSRTNSNLDFSNITDQASAVASNSYLEFSIAINAGSKVSLETIYAKLRRSGAGAKNYIWSYSIDDSEFVDINATPVSFTNSATSGVQQEPIDLSTISALQNLESAKVVKFRLYSWGYTTTTGSFALGLSESNSEDVLTIMGTVINTLPVNLTAFEASKLNNTIKLRWTTASELNNSHFEILKSNDGENWNILTTVSGAGNSSIQTNYQYIDRKPFSGLNYYQLKQVDFDGKVTLSKITNVNFDVENTAVKITGNYSNQTLTIFTNGLVADKGKLQLYNINGQLLTTQNVIAINSNKNFTLSIGLKSGVYVVLLNTEEGVYSAKIIVP